MRKLLESKVENVNELVVLLETGFKTPPIEKLTNPPAANIPVPNPFEIKILLPVIVHVMAVWKPAIEEQEASAVGILGKLT